VEKEYRMESMGKANSAGKRVGAKGA